LLPFIFIKVLAPGYYARQDTKTPVKIGIIAMVVNMVINIILMLQFAHVGLALATALSAALNAGMLYRGLRKEGVYQPRTGWMRFSLKLLLPNLGLLMTLYWLNPNLTQWLAASGWDRSLMLLGVIAAAAAVYFVLLRLVGIRIRQLLKPMPTDIN